ncbi:hypothetical protein MVEN_00298300 [Mycena venus]|uniref:Uncharacterized protein n=1 Tax=Mycena venus TaxID=2733690 RepID=A0A8H7DE59_9AGAR|nr:hypothetical protein MVEN_00298300 [Mycena venus]
MFSDAPEQSVFSLGHPSPSSRVGDADSDSASEKPIYPPQRRRFETRAFLSKLLGPPGIVILGQLLLQIAAWGFFATINSRDFIPIRSLGPDPTSWFKLITWVCNQISTALAGCSSYFFSWGVRQSITLRLRGEGMSMATFVSSVQISSRSLIRDPKKIKWTALSMVVFGLTVLQTAGWSNLITPQVLDFDAPVDGVELDLSSPLLQPMSNSGALDYCVVNSTNLPAFTVGQTESGYVAVNGDLEFPASVTLMDQAFFSSTAGILPLTFKDVDIDVSKWFPGMTSIPGTLGPSTDFSKGLSSEYSLIQQGFTADVTCEFKDLTSETSPSLVIQKDPLNDSTNGTQSSLTFLNMSSNCAGPNGPQLNSTSAYAYLDDGSGYLLMVACGDSSEGLTLILAGSGLYAFMKTMVCTLSPKITTVQVDYSYDFFSGTITTNTLPGGVSDVGGPAGLSAITTLYNMFYFSQAPQTSIVGDQLKTLIQDLDGNVFDNDHILNITAEYIRGVTEYSGSIFRACLSSENNGIFVHGVPTNMTTPTSSGEFHIQFIGWALSRKTSWVLIPGTLVAIATISVVLAALVHHAADPEGEVFDLSNTLDLVSASAAGGLSNVFSESTKDHIKEANDVNIVLGDIAGRGTALKRRIA